MPLVTAGLNHMVQATIGAAVTAFNNANARLGVGDSNAVFAAGHTDLQAATNKLRKTMEAGYPSGAANVVTFRSVFAESEANWVWNEVGLFNAGPTGGTMLARLVQALGTKANGTVWELTYQLTVTLA